MTVSESFILWRNRIMSVKTRIAIVFSLSMTSVLFISVWNSNNDFIRSVKPFLESSHYVFSSEPIEIIGKTLDEKIEPIGEKNIFFLETSSFGDEGIVLTSRQACSIESAAKTNPGMRIYLIIFSHVNFSSTSVEKLNILSVYKNIAIRRISVEDYLQNTPIEEWWGTGIMKSSLWPIPHTSDVLRFATLWKFGGIYLDLDVIVRTSLENITNFAVAEDDDWLGSAALGFSATGVGKKVAHDSLQDLQKNFQGHEWAQQGPRLITRVLRNLCGTSSIRNMMRKSCRGFTIYPALTFYPIHYDDWQLLFDKGNNATMNKINKALAIHVWNSHSSKIRIKVGSQVPFALLASEYCPKIYYNSGEFF